MKRVWLFLTMSLPAQTLAAPAELISVDLSQLMGRIAAELSVSDVALPGRVMLPKSEASQACGLPIDSIFDVCTAVYGTDAVQDAIAMILHSKSPAGTRNR